MAQTLQNIGDISVITNDEILGRAIEQDIKKKFVFEGGDSLKHDWQCFFDKRPGGLSVDRLGRGRPHRNVVNFIEPLAEKRAANIGQKFWGWALIQTKQLNSLQFKADPDPVAPEEGVDANPYHSLIDHQTGCNPMLRASALALLSVHYEKNFLPCKELKTAVQSPALQPGATTDLPTATEIVRPKSMLNALMDLIRLITLGKN